MRTNMSIQDRLLCGFSIIFNRKFTKGTKALYCPHCKGNRFEDIFLKESNYEYTAEYKCKKCGAIVHTKEKWTY